MKSAFTVFAVACSIVGLRAAEFPEVFDSKVVLTKFAGSDLIKHPIGMTYTADGKLLAVESHTHLRPKNYDGPESDQILWLRDTDGDGKADRRSVFFGTNLRATMNIATHPKTGAIYVATKDGVIRLWDKNKNGVVDLYSAERIVYFHFDSKYLDNGYGCAGLSFDPEGNLIFGIGGILGAPYYIHGSDGTKFADQGEGGNVWKCTENGEKLERFATGFWNPFGICQTPEGQVFVTDNDPSSRPPSRLHHVIEGGDYGYQFRYGHSGQHPFISWDGELPGTLPMLSGTGDAPCDVLFHKGNLLVASWSDHRVEVYPLTWNKTHFSTERTTLLKGGIDFRPVGFARAENGDLYISDWIKGDYQLHGNGTIWRLQNWNPEQSHWNPATCESRENSDADSVDAWDFSRMISGQIPEVDMPPGKKQIFDLLSARFHNQPEGPDLIREALDSEQDSETLRLLALKWIADKQLEEFRPEVEAEILNPVSPKIFHAAITTKARIEGHGVMDTDIQKLVMAELDAKSPLARRAAFLLLDEREKVEIARLRKIYQSGDEEMRSGVALTLKNHEDTEGARAFAREIIEKDESAKVRSLASLADPDGPEVRSEDSLEIGEFLFHKHCATCHRVNGFGRKGGPDISKIGVRGKEHIIRSVVDPSAEISPQYETWKVKMGDGTERVGFVIGEKSGKHFYSDASGIEFIIDTSKMVDREHLPVSLMPPMLNEKMGEEDFQHLVDWLAQLK